MTGPSANSPWRITRVGETGSTNADVLAAARDGAPAGLVLVAGHQTAGRGRLDRRWEAPPGTNLLLSLLLRPAGPPETWFRVTMAVAVAAADALHGIGADVGIKWPNDLVVGDDKLAGILAETDGAGAVVVGVGVNVAWPKKRDLPGATSLHALGLDVTPNLVLEFLLDAFDPASIDDPDLLERYRARCATTGRDVEILLPDETTVAGRATGVDDEGLLVVEVAASPEEVAAGGPALLTRRFAVGDVVHARRA